MTSPKDDLFAPVRQKLLDENRTLLVALPQELEAGFAKPGRRAARVAAGWKFASAVPPALAVGMTEYIAGVKGGGK